jgi:hypothetical protein
MHAPPSEPLPLPVPEPASEPPPSRLEPELLPVPERELLLPDDPDPVADSEPDPVPLPEGDPVPLPVCDPEPLPDAVPLPLPVPDALPEPRPLVAPASLPLAVPVPDELEHAAVATPSPKLARAPTHDAVPTARTNRSMPYRIASQRVRQPPRAQAIDDGGHRLLRPRPDGERVGSPGESGRDGHAVQLVVAFVDHSYQAPRMTSLLACPTCARHVPCTAALRKGRASALHDAGDGG